MQNHAPLSPRSSSSHLTQHSLAPEAHAELRSIGEDLLSRGVPENLKLLPLASRVTPEDIRKIVLTGPVFACDFYIEGIEQYFNRATGVLSVDGITNIDHHAALPEMYRFVSSGNLAARYVEKHGALPVSTPVVINHTDCDSVVSALIMTGALPVHPAFERAVIAADHTGDRHAIGDLLQALDRSRNLELSVRSLGCLLSGQPLPEEARVALSRREAERTALETDIARNDYWSNGQFVFIRSTDRVDSALLPSYFPQAVLVCACRESPERPGEVEVRLRLSGGAPEGFSLSLLAIRETFDPNFGGRWNAGSNRRGRIVGVRLTADQYRDHLVRATTEALSIFGK